MIYEILINLSLVKMKKTLVIVSAIKIKKIIFLLFTFNLYSYADLTKEFPSYSYVLNEFDLHSSYIHNREFESFVYKNKDAYQKRFRTAVSRGALIVPTMKETMYKSGITPLFLYLSMTESAFKTEAKSTSAAGGLWQFMPPTGREQKLTINSNIDERYDPVKSTHAAVDYLYKIRGGLDKWYLAAMAYNCGQGCVKRGVAKAGTKDLATLINPQEAYLPAETRKYIKKILLFAMIGENYLFKRDNNLGEAIYRMNKDSLTPVRVRDGERLQTIASMLKMDYRVLKRTNMHLKKDFVPRGSKVMVNIPTSRLGMFRAVYNGNRNQNYVNTRSANGSNRMANNQYRRY
ncbi:MAG: lytic transglycosylase domain-containing protein [Sulfurovaceae bacterium]|nr:lytic transglycosylase domain-containing protein [Sulfurovaceae bacterium]